MNNQQDNQNEIIDIKGLLHEYAQKWWLFVVCIVVCVGLAFIYAKISQPEYSVKANILISQDEEKSSGSGFKAMFGDIAGMFGAKGSVDDEVYVVASHSVLRDVARELQINKRHFVKINLLQKVFKYKEFPVDIYAAPGMADTLMTPIEFRLKVKKDGKARVKVYARGDKIATAESASLPLNVETPYGQFTLNKTQYFEPGKSLNTTIEYSGYDVAAEQLAEEANITVANKKANVIALSTRSADTEFSKDFINQIIEKYNERGISDRNLKSQKTLDFIQGRLALLSGELGESEDRMEGFKRDQGMTDFQADLTYEFNRKGSLEQELVRNEAARLILHELQAYAKDPANEFSLMPSTTATIDAQEAINSYNALVLQRIDLMNTAKGQNISLKKIENQISAMRENLIESLAKAERSSALTVGEIRRKMGEADTKLGRVPYQQKIYQSLLREQTLKEELYIFLLQRAEETAMSLANTTPKAVIIDYAYSLSEPLGMGKKMIVGIGFLIGLLLAPVILYFRRLLRDKFDTKDELERLTRIPMLGEVCTSRRGETLVVKASGGSTSISELFRLIRANLQFILNDQHDRVILMTSTVSGEGKSFVSINLASSLALLGKKVVLVGMDIRAPKLAEYLPLQPRYGLTQYLANSDIPLSDIILKSPVVEGMDIITAGPVPPNPSELLLSDRVDKLFAELREMYDYVIVDSAPVGMVSDTFSLVRISDATVYVCRANYTTLRDVKFFNDLYADGRLRKMSLIVNGTSARKGYGYGYGEDNKSRKRRDHR